jgi:hypothetical protein
MPTPGGGPKILPQRVGGGNGGTTAPGQTGIRPARGRGAQGKGQGATKGQGIGVGGGALPGPGGRQLASRVSSGKITSEQAQKTMQQRQTLAKALGPDWREKLSAGVGKSFAQVNAGLKKNPGNAKLAALRKKLKDRRTALLEEAREKDGGREAGKTEGGE